MCASEDEAVNVAVNARKYVADDRWRLRLFECIAAETRRIAGALKEPRFSVQAGCSDEEFRQRVAALDELLADLCGAEAIIGRWGTRAMRDSLTLGPRRLSDGAGEGGGHTAWLALQWYPALLLSYAGGIAAVAAESYDSLLALMHARVGTSRGDARLVAAATTGISDLRRHFKLLPGHESQHVPLSEHLYETLKPILEEILFLGSDYDRAFDIFEIMYAVEFMYQSERGWGPVGRFGWKAGRGGSRPLRQLADDAAAASGIWPPLAAGLSGGSPEKLKENLDTLNAIVARSGMW
jgi:hypothetical protein